MITTVTLELLKARLKDQKYWLKHENKLFIDSKSRYEKSQKDRNETIKYIENLENDIKVIQEEEAK